MKRRKQIILTAAALFFSLANELFPSAQGTCCADEISAVPASRLAGCYISFEETGGETRAVLKKGILTLEDGMISGIADYEEALSDVIYLDDECVIYPGLLDLHSHVEYNSFQLWLGNENKQPWDNRFEWRVSMQEIEDLRDKYAALKERWEEPFGKIDAVMGDIVEYFAELQAAAGGTTMIQGYNQTDAYDTADSHEKVDLIRDTCYASDLGAEPGLEVTCLIQLYKPDAELLTDDPSTYLPPIDTSGWNLTLQINALTGKTYLDEMLERISRKTSGGYLIHLGEGRAGNLLESADAYSRREFEDLKNVLREGVKAGDFSVEDVRNAHINLLHACSVNLRDEDDYRFISEYGIGLVWSPLSNLILYEDTPAHYEYLGDQELLIAIGSDWSPSGSKTVWDECKSACLFMQKHMKDTDRIIENLLKACTYTAGRMIGHPEAGNIKEGCYADLFILRGKEAADGNVQAALRTFIETDDSGVEAVLVGGKCIYGEDAFLEKMAGKEQAVYGKHKMGLRSLQTKSFLLPEAFAGSTFKEVYDAYTVLLSGIGIQMSALRRLEDPVYNAAVRQILSQSGK